MRRFGHFLGGDQQWWLNYLNTSSLAHTWVDIQIQFQEFFRFPHTFRCFQTFATCQSTRELVDLCTPFNVAYLPIQGGFPQTRSLFNRGLTYYQLMYNLWILCSSMHPYGDLVYLLFCFSAFLFFFQALYATPII